jgi:translation initiation factor IF-2
MRFFELAKELNYSPKDLVKEVNAKNIKVKNHLVTLDEDTAKKIRALFSKPAKAVKHPKKEKDIAPTPKSKEKPKTPDIEPEKTEPIAALIDKPAHTEKDIRAIRPSELDEKENPVEGKDKRRLKVFSKSFSPSDIAYREKISATSFGLVTPAPAAPRPVITKKPEGSNKIFVDSDITPKILSEKIGIKANLIVKKLMGHGLRLDINTKLDEDALVLIGLEFNQEIEIRKAKNALDGLEKKEAVSDLVARPPVVVVMGHVDHGKTTLLDRIRGTDVASGEAGAITQHIGAYQVTVKDKKITFIDTPGHQAFTNMRARGANVTDIAILVVAADDGVMPQTEEAVSHIKAANATVIVAINKVDKKEANILKVKQQLAVLELNPEEWGGQTIFVEVSATTGQGIDKLLDMILLQADILELKANPKSKARGSVLEVKFSEGMGPLATVLIQNGTLHIGDLIVCGGTYGKVRAMYDDKFNQIDQAGPSTPVGINGLTDLPEVGDKLFVLDDNKKVKEIAEKVLRDKKIMKTQIPKHLTLETLYKRISDDKMKEVKVILKTDVKGSLEVLQELINSMSGDEVKMKVIQGMVGPITEADVALADVSDAIVIGFNSFPDDRAKEVGQERGIQIKTYNIIYHVLEDLKLAMAGMLKPVEVEVITAHLIVKQVFKISRYGNIAGSQVADGTIKRSDNARVKRGKDVIFSGKLASLKRFKEDVSEVAQGFECGVRIEGFDDLQPGDVVESYRVEIQTRKI